MSKSVIRSSGDFLTCLRFHLESVAAFLSLKDLSPLLDLEPANFVRIACPSRLK